MGHQSLFSHPFKRELSRDFNDKEKKINLWLIFMLTVTWDDVADTYHNSTDFKVSFCSEPS